jgi:hypothetical protein
MSHGATIPTKENPLFCTFVILRKHFCQRYDEQVLLTPQPSLLDPCKIQKHAVNVLAPFQYINGRHV